MAVNVPTALIAALRGHYDNDGAAVEPLLIHLSTDQVYSGSDALSTEAGGGRLEQASTPPTLNRRAESARPYGHSPWR
jgi:hypothetical protein